MPKITNCESDDFITQLITLLFQEIFEYFQDNKYVTLLKRFSFYKQKYLYILFNSKDRLQCIKNKLYIGIYYSLSLYYFISLEIIKPNS